MRLPITIMKGSLRCSFVLGKRADRRAFRRYVAFLTALWVISSSAIGANGGPRNPSSSDKCPVCGMFVAKYPNWVAEIVFKDGTVAFFDGVKDLCHYYLQLSKYAPLKKREDIESIFVKEYYGLKFVNGFKAYYVIGSDVLGPMGNELIPLNSEDDAKAFLQDHKGKKILTFSDVTADLVESLQ